MINFTRIIYLYFLLLAPLAILIHFLTLKWKRSRALQFANFEAIAKVKGIDLLSKNTSILMLTSLILVVLVFSLAGMQVQMTLTATDFSFGIAIDTSKSMEATDFLPSRLEAAKEMATDFIELLPKTTKVAVVSFSGNAFIEQSITADKTILRQAIKEIPLSTVGGTDLGEAVITSSNLLAGENSKAIILLSDGQINVGTIEDVINYANDESVVIHTIGIGTEEGGETSFGLSKLDEQSLQAISFNTGGKFFMAKNKQELRDSLNAILELKEKKVFVDFSSYLLIAALVLIILEFVLINTRFKIFP